MSSTRNPLLTPFIKYVKVAVAVAIIKRKPKNLTGKEYAEKLCGQFIQSQAQWSKRSERLEEEVLLLKQKLYQKELESSLKSCQDCEDFSFLEDENICDVTTSHARPPPLSQHVQFLRSVFALKSASISSLPDNKDISNITLCTIKAAIKTIQNWLTNDSRCQTLSEDLLDATVSIICRLSTCEFLYIKDAVRASILSLIQGLIMALISQQQLNRACSQITLTSMLDGLSKSPVLRKEIILGLLSTVSECSGMLRRSLSDTSELQVGPYENLAHVLSLLGSLLRLEGRMRSVQTRAMLRAGGRAGGKPWGICEEITEELCGEMARELDACILNLTDDYPLFAHGVWRLQGQIAELSKLF